MADTRVFLTGATGYAGQEVLAELVRRGFAVTALVRSPVNLAGGRGVVGDLSAIDTVASEIAACDAIVHLASPRSADQSEVLRQDIAGIAGLIEAWRKGRFIYTSASTVYADPLGPLTERAPIGLAGWYGLGKFANELQLRLAERQQGRAGAALLRPAIVFTVNARRHDRQFLGNIYAQCQRGARFAFDSENGLETYGCSFIGGNDFGCVIAESITHDLSGAYNIAGGFCTWRKLIETINRVGGTRGDFVVRPDAAPQAGDSRLPQTRMDLETTAFEKATGFKPRQTLEEIVEAFVRMERAQQPA